MQRWWLYCLVLIVIASPARGQSIPFSWDQATIYHLVTDRFSNGNSQNDGAYGRGLDGEGAPYLEDANGHFQGGDFAGITGWIESGYFTELGVNALLVSAPFEQVHGWTGGGDGSTQEYAFHGRWTLDYTEPDAAFGSMDDFRRLVDTAHEKGIRVLIEVDLTGPGPATLHDMSAFNFGQTDTPVWRSWRPAGGSNWNTYESHFLGNSGKSEDDSLAQAWKRWWGPSWVAGNLPGYDDCPDQDACAGIAGTTFKDSAGATGIPDFLQLKWGEEKTAEERAELDAFFARTGYERSARASVIKWMSDWVRDFGIDGFMVQDAERLSPTTLTRLKAEASRAYGEWSRGNAGLGGESRFWLGVIPSPGAVSTLATFSGGPSIAGSNGLSASVVDAVLAYDSTKLLASSRVEALADPDGSAAEPEEIMRISGPGIGLGGRRDHAEAATRLFLFPGPIGIYYGDELARKPGNVNDPHLAAMSSMDWAAAEPESLPHWKKLAAFRAAHPSVARGANDVVLETPFTFYRGIKEGNAMDQVVIALGAEGRIRINVSPIWPDDTVLRDAYSGKISIVSFGQVSFDPDPSGIVLIEEVKE